MRYRWGEGKMGERVPPFQDLHTLALNICTGESTIEAWVKQGVFPQPIKVGGKRLWRWKDIEKFLTPKPIDIDEFFGGNLKGITNATKKAAAEPH